MLCNNYWSRNLICPYLFWVISPRNSTSFTRPFLAGRPRGLMKFIRGFASKKRQDRGSWVHHGCRAHVLSRTQFNSSPVWYPWIQLSTWSLHSQFRRASLCHALSLKALQLRHSVKMITSQVQFKFHQYQNTTFFFAISPNLMPAKFFHYTVII